MKIIWTDGQKDIPGVGRVNAGDEIDVAEDTARALIAQGQAKRKKPKKLKRGN